MRKVDRVTGEAFDCTPEGRCWCLELPPVTRDVEEPDCIGPTRLRAAAERRREGDARREPG